MPIDIPADVVVQLKAKLNNKFETLYYNEVAPSIIVPIGIRHTKGAADQVIEAFIERTQEEDFIVPTEYFKNPKNLDKLVEQLQEENKEAVLNYFKSYRPTRTISGIHVSETIREMGRSSAQKRREISERTASQRAEMRERTARAAKARLDTQRTKGRRGR